MVGVLLWANCLGVHLGFGIVDECTELLQSGTKSVGVISPGLHGTLEMGFEKGFPDRGAGLWAHLPRSKQRQARLDPLSLLCCFDRIM